MVSTLRLSLLAVSIAALAQQQNPRLSYPPELPDARAEVYKTIGGGELKLWIFEPQGHKAADRRPAIVFFFGGGWNSGSPKQFELQSKHLASRGMVAITADYRVASRHQVKVVDCVRDAKSAIRWVRSNATRLGIDPDRIAAAGGSAGGHLAAATAILPGFDEAAENTQVSSKPNALVLFNPALILAPLQESAPSPDLASKFTAERAGTDPKAVSPYHHLAEGAPPAIVFHGKADTTVPYRTVEAFARKSASLGNRCDLIGYEGQPHGFFNYGRGTSEYYEKTLKAADEFLVSIGYLKAR